MHVRHVTCWLAARPGACRVQLRSGTCLSLVHTRGARVHSALISAGRWLSHGVRGAFCNSAMVSVCFRCLLG